MEAIKEVERVFACLGNIFYRLWKGFIAAGVDQLGDIYVAGEGVLPCLCAYSH